MKETILTVNNLKKHFPIQKGIFRRVVGTVKAVDGVSFTLYRGETLGLVGESGCGKTTTGRCLMRLIDSTEGEIRFGAEAVDISRLSERGLKPFRRRMQMIFQDPHSSLNSRMTVKDIVAEPLVMMDQETKSLWSHILGRAMQGDLEGTELESLPSVMTTWGTWKQEHPETTVLNLSRTKDRFMMSYKKAWDVFHPDSRAVTHQDRVEER